jgi:hypothetical protein
LPSIILFQQFLIGWYLKVLGFGGSLESIEVIRRKDLGWRAGPMMTRGGGGEAPSTEMTKDGRKVAVQQEGGSEAPSTEMTKDGRKVAVQESSPFFTNIER